MSSGPESVPATREGALAEARRILAAPTRVAVLTGAGMSTEAGVPDFRSPGGLYSEDFHGLHPEDVLSRDFLALQPELFYEYLRTRLAIHAEPDASYRRLADLERAGRIAAVVTQNIDGLHTAAGSRNVIEAHGTLARFSCAACGRAHDAGRMIRRSAASAAASSAPTWCSTAKGSPPSIGPSPPSTTPRRCSCSAARSSSIRSPGSCRRSSTPAGPSSSSISSRPRTGVHPGSSNSTRRSARRSGPSSTERERSSTRRAGGTSVPGTTKPPRGLHPEAARHEGITPTRSSPAASR